MLKFIIRLDDACETMNEEKWIKMEQLLDKYNIKPIVGIIPENKDPQFSFKVIDDFWTKYALKWQNKNWIIAQHGLFHKYHYYKKNKKNIRTEFYGLEYETQKKMLKKGYDLLQKKGINATCFFAPNHTFDKNTIIACRDLGYYKFISDGCAQFPFVQFKMLHIPNIFDTPHKILNNGIYTFVFHPNYINDEILINLENFILKYKTNFEFNIDDIIKEFSGKKRSLLDNILKVLIKFYRIMKGNHSDE